MVDKMKSSELLFEFNFLSSVSKSPDLEKLYEAADKVKASIDIIDNCEQDYHGISYPDALSRLGQTMAEVEEISLRVKEAQDSLVVMKQQLKRAKDMQASLSDSLPKKATAALKKIVEVSEEFTGLVQRSELDLATLPTLQETFEAVKKLSK